MAFEALPKAADVCVPRAGGIFDKRQLTILRGVPPTGETVSFFMQSCAFSN